jgi:hypothetical protein
MAPCSEFDAVRLEMRVDGSWYDHVQTQRNLQLKAWLGYVHTWYNHIGMYCDTEFGRLYHKYLDKLIRDAENPTPQEVEDVWIALGRIGHWVAIPSYVLDKDVNHVGLLVSILNRRRGDTEADGHPRFHFELHHKNHLGERCVLVITRDESRDRAARIVKDALWELQQAILLPKRQPDRRQPQRKLLGTESPIRRPHRR